MSVICFVHLSIADHTSLVGALQSNMFVSTFDCWNCAAGMDVVGTTQAKNTRIRLVMNLTGRI